MRGKWRCLKQGGKRGEREREREREREGGGGKRVCVCVCEIKKEREGVYVCVCVWGGVVGAPQKENSKVELNLFESVLGCVTDD